MIHWINMKKHIIKGVYVVVDPAMPKSEILKQLDKIKEERIAAIQIWDNPKLESVEESLLQDIVDLFSKSNTPILINNHWELLKTIALDGVHFDRIPEDLPSIITEIDKPFLKGLTLENDLTAVGQAEKLQFDYLSFCSIFPSSTSDTCEIVKHETIQRCREITSMPIFLAGGIDLENSKLLKNLPFDGFAVVSSVMKAEDPKEIVKQYNTIIKI